VALSGKECLETGRYNAGARHRASAGGDRPGAVGHRAGQPGIAVDPYGDTAIKPAAIDVLEGVSRHARRVGVT